MNELATKLRNMKNNLGLSNKELSDLSKVPIGTVNRVLAGRVETPNFQTIHDLVKAMGGSLDDLDDILLKATQEKAENTAEETGKESGEQSVSPKPEEHPAAGLPVEVIHAYDALLQEKERAIETKDLWLKRMFIACCVLVGIIIAVLIFDLLNPSVGFFMR